MPDIDENNTDTTSEKNRPEFDDDRLKRAIGLAVLVSGIYVLDRLLGDEETITTADKKQISIKRTFIDDILD